MKNIPHINRIGTRIIILSVLLLMTSIIGTGLLIVNFSARVMRDNISRSNLEIARRASSEIQLYVQDALAQLKAVSGILTLLQENRLVRDIMLENLGRNLEKYGDFLLLNSSGRIIASSSLGGKEHYDDPVLLKHALTGGTYISQIKLSSDNLPYITIALPVEVLGTVSQVLVAEFNLRDIWDLIDNISLGKSGRAFLISKTGFLLAHPDKSIVFASALQARIPALPDSIPENGITLVQETEQGNKMLMAYMPVQNTEWIVALEQPASEAYLPLGTVLIRSLILMAVGIVLASAASFLIARSVSGPLLKLLDGTKIIGKGDLDHRIEIRSKDEIGKLSEAFNEMVVRLKKWSEDLKESEENYRLITENASDIIFTLDSEGLFIFLNRRFEDITGFKLDEFIGRHFFKLLTPQSRRTVAVILRKQKKKPVPDFNEFETAILSNGEEEIDLDVKIVWVPGSDGHAHFYGVGRDITERKRMQEQLFQAEKLSAVGELVSGVAHELNNPLTGIMGYSELFIMDPDISDEIKEDAKKINREAIRAQKIVQNLLSFSRKYALERISCNINELIDRVFDIRVYAMAVSQIEVVKAMDPELPHTVADPNLMRQIFLNIVNNAIQAMEESSDKRVLRVETSADEDKIIIIFSNSGPGIPGHILSKIFDPFFTTKKAGEGTGLGLSVSHRIIQDHEGKIFARNNDSGGVDFVIELPLISGGGTEEADGAEHEITEGEKEKIILPHVNILVVDDERSIVYFIQQALKAQGCSVYSAYSGAKALQYLTENDCDLVVCDLRMPGIDGREIYSWAKENKPHIAKRFVFITGDTVNPEAKAFFENSGVLYLRKPFGIDELIKIINNCLNS